MLTRKVAGILAATTFGMMQATLGCADTPSLGAIDAPLGHDTHAAVVVLLRKLGETHAEEVANTAKTLRPSAAGQIATVRFVRIEAPAYCDLTRCLTFVLSGADEHLSVGAMVYAGKNVGLAEPTDELFSSAICFWTHDASPKDTVCATNTQLGWIDK